MEWDRGGNYHLGAGGLKTHFLVVKCKNYLIFKNRGSKPLREAPKHLKMGGGGLVR